MFEGLRRSGFGLLVAGLVCSLAGCGSGGDPFANQPVSPTTGPGVTYSPTSLNFGTIALGSTSAAQSVTVKSSGTAPLVITSFSNSGDYQFSYGNCPSSPSTLAVGATCRLDVTFSPLAPGTRPGTMFLGTNVTNAPSVALTGVGGSTTDTVSSSALNFGSVALGSTSATQTVTITATGTTPLYLSSLVMSGDFARPATNCTAALAPGSSCTVTLTFTPTALGSRTGSLTIGSNNGTTPQTVSLTGTGVPPATFAGPTFRLGVLAGTQPVAQSSVQLYTAGATGSGSAATALLAQALLTDATGTVTIPGGYACSSALAPVYAVASGGTIAGSAANGNIRLLTALGPCGNLTASEKYVDDEATTVAGAYALAQFYGGAAAIGATATNLTGITNAFATAASLVDPVAGTSPGSTLPATAASPAARIDSLANALNGCVVSPATCGALYAATTVSGAVPANTLDAVINLAKNPALNTAAVYALAQTKTAYSPALTAQPTDWTMFVTYTGGGMNSPAGIGVDSTGSVWVSSYFYIASKFTPVGTPVFANGLTGVGINNSYGLAVDANDLIWIPNEQPFTSYGIGSVTVLTPTGGFISGGGGFQQGGLSYPLSVAIDPNGTTWVVDYGNSHVTLLNSLGTPLSGISGYTTDLFAFPVSVAVDANHFGWIANQSSNTVTKVAPDGSSFTNYTCCMGASGLAIDQGNNVWVANFYGDSVSLISNSGTVIGNASYTGNGGISRPQGIAIDGAGNVWVANYRQVYLTELAGAGATNPGASLTPKGGYGADSGLLEAYAMSIDASGNIWVTNQGNNSLTKFVGLAVPVKTPLLMTPKAP